MTLLVTGGSGKLGRELVKLFPDCLHPTHKELDITHSYEVMSFVKAHDVDSIIHCAANTSIRDCEEHRTEAFLVNVFGTQILCHELGLAEFPYFLDISSPCVFPGDLLEHHYSESDIPYPKNFYGITKRAGEDAVIAWREQDRCRKYLIIRTNFIDRGKWHFPQAFTDRFANYVFTDQLAQAIHDLYVNKETGLVHVCGDKIASMFDFASLNDPSVKPITMKNYVGPPLTVNMCLSSRRLQPIHFA